MYLFDKTFHQQNFQSKYAKIDNAVSGTRNKNTHIENKIKNKSNYKRKPH